MHTVKENQLKLEYLSVINVSVSICSCSCIIKGTNELLYIMFKFIVLLLVYITSDLRKSPTSYGMGTHL